MLFNELYKIIDFNDVILSLKNKTITNQEIKNINLLIEKYKESNFLTELQIEIHKYIKQGV